MDRSSRTRLCKHLVRRWPFFRSFDSLLRPPAGSAYAWRHDVVICPQPKTALESIFIRALTTARRKRFELADITSTDHCLIGLQCGNQPPHNVGHMTIPFFLTNAFQAGAPDVIFVGLFLVRQVA